MPNFPSQTRKAIIDFSTVLAKDEPKTDLESTRDRLEQAETPTAPERKWLTLDSSRIRRVIYGRDEQTLIVEFKNRIQHAYGNVTQKDFDALVNAKSPGRYLEQIIATHSGVRLESE